MKQLLFIIAVSLMTLTASGQNVEKFINKYKDTNGTEYANITKDMLRTLSQELAKTAKETDAKDKALTFIDNIEQFEVLTFENKNQQWPENLMADLQSFSQKDYELLIDVQEDLSVKIMQRKAPKKLYETLIIVCPNLDKDEDITLVRILAAKDIISLAQAAKEGGSDVKLLKIGDRDILDKLLK